MIDLMMMTMVVTMVMALMMTMMMAVKVILSPTADAEKLARLDWVRTTVPALEYVFRFVISIEIKIRR